MGYLAMDSAWDLAGGSAEVRPKFGQGFWPRFGQGFGQRFGSDLARGSAKDLAWGSAESFARDTKEPPGEASIRFISFAKRASLGRFVPKP